MSNGQNSTRKEHYIPQALLKGFTEDGKMIWQYDVEKKEGKYVPIKSIFYKKDLYEFKIGDKIYQVNHFEKELGKIEAEFAKQRDKIEQYVKIEDNYKIKSFLKEEEKNFWKFFIILHMMRHPRSLELMEQTLKEGGYDTERAHNQALALNLPFQTDIAEGNYSSIQVFWGLFDNVAFQVGYDKTGSLFMIERVGCFIPDKNEKLYLGVVNEDFMIRPWKTIYFPISKNIIISLYNLNVHHEKSLFQNRNVLKKLDGKQLDFIKKTMKINAEEYILSAKPLIWKNIFKGRKH